MDFPEEKNLKLKPGDIILLAFFILFSIVLFLKPFAAKSNNLILEVIKDGKVVYELSLSSSGEWDISDEKVKFRFAILKDKKVTVLDSNCPQQICVKSKMISKPGETIICIPNKIILIIKGKEEPPVDTTTY